MKSIKHILAIIIIALFSTIAFAQEMQVTEDQKAQMKAELEVFYEKLNLSEAQKPKFEEITKKYGKHLLALKDSDKSRFSKYKTFKKINNNRDKELKPLLTEAQFETYQELREEMQKKMKEKQDGKR